MGRQMRIILRSSRIFINIRSIRRDVDPRARVRARLHALTLAIPFGRTREIPLRDLARDDARASIEEAVRSHRRAGPLFRISRALAR
jgi:hypothetical protein